MLSVQYTYEHQMTFSRNYIEFDQVFIMLIITHFASRKVSILRSVNITDYEQ